MADCEMLDDLLSFAAAGYSTSTAGRLHSANSGCRTPYCKLEPPKPPLFRRTGEIVREALSALVLGPDVLRSLLIETQIRELSSPKGLCLAEVTRHNCYE